MNECVLTHSTFADMLSGDDGRRSFSYSKSNEAGLKSSSPRVECCTWNNTCNYCRHRGHWKKECSALKAQSRSNFGQVKSSALVATVRKSVCTVPGVELLSKTVSKKSDYSAFISEGSCHFQSQIKKLQ